MKLIFRNTTSGHNDSDHAECSVGWFSLYRTASERKSRLCAYHHTMS